MSCASGLYIEIELSTSVRAHPHHAYVSFWPSESVVLLDRLFSIDVNGKTWRLIRNWYAGGTCFVHVDGASSSYIFSYWKGCPPRINPITNPFQHCDGPTPKDPGVFRSIVNNLYNACQWYPNTCHFCVLPPGTDLNFTSNSFLQLYKPYQFYWWAII